MLFTFCRVMLVVFGSWMAFGPYASLAVSPVPSSSSPCELSCNVVAVVGEHVVTSAELRERIRIALASNPSLARDPQAAEHIWRPVLQERISELLFMNVAQQAGLSVSEQETDQAIERIEVNNHMPAGGMLQFAKQHHLSLPVLRQQIQASILRSKVVHYQAGEEADISENELNESLASHGVQSDVALGHLEVSFQQIWAPYRQTPKAGSMAKQKQDILRDMERIQKSHQNCATIKEVVERINPQYIIEPTEHARVDSLSDSVRDIVLKLSIGRFSHPIHETDGIRLILLCDKVDHQFQVKHAITDTLLQQKLHVREEELLHQLRRDTFIEIRSVDINTLRP